MKLKFSTGNAKLNKTAKVLSELRGTKYKIASFNLPAPKACPGAGACKGPCYAQQGRYIYRAAIAVRENNFSLCQSLLSKSEGTLTRALEEGINSIPGKQNLILRMHDSGDFYSPEYARAWMNVAWNNPDKQFYCYTKSTDFLPEFFLANELENFHVCCSLGGKHDTRTLLLAEANPGIILSRIFPVWATGKRGQVTPEDKTRAHKSMLAAGYIDGNSEEGDMTLLLARERGINRIGLVYHGTKKMTPAQARSLA